MHNSGLLILSVITGWFLYLAIKMFLTGLGKINDKKIGKKLTNKKYIIKGILLTIFIIPFFIFYIYLFVIGNS